MTAGQIWSILHFEHWLLIGGFLTHLGHLNDLQLLFTSRLIWILITYLIWVLGVTLILYVGWKPSKVVHNYNISQITHLPLISSYIVEHYYNHNTLTKLDLICNRTFMSQSYCHTLSSGCSKIHELVYHNSFLTDWDVYRQLGLYDLYVADVTRP